MQGQERIHRADADARLLAIPTSWSRVADYSRTETGFLRFALPRGFASPLYRPFRHVCSPGRKGHDDLTSSPLSSVCPPAVSPESPALRAGNRRQGLRSLKNLISHISTRADDSHAAPVFRCPEEADRSLKCGPACKPW